MSKNHMSSIAEILGVEINKGFKVYRGSSFLGTYKITENGLIYDDTSKSDEIVLEDILTGQCRIKKEWKPKKNEYYYVPAIINGNVYRYNYQDCEFDDNFMKKGLVCKTPEEAIELAEVALEAIKKYREG